jgi:hypothetical protein
VLLLLAWVTILNHGSPFDHLREGFDLDIPGILTPRVEFIQTGPLPMSSRLVGTLYRWHNPKYFWSGADFWRTFQNGPRKLSSQERYAGHNINCGHYFALSAKGAAAEAHFYRMDLTRCRLLEVEISLESVLDLTHEDNIRQIGLSGAIENPEAFGDDFFMGTLSHLLASERGGNGLTDYIGCKALRDEYDGVLFFGARALQAFPDLEWQIFKRRDIGMGIPLVPSIFYEMRKEHSLKNLVVFSGRVLTTKILRYRMPPNDYVDNLYFGTDAATLPGDDFEETCDLPIIAGGIELVDWRERSKSEPSGSSRSTIERLRGQLSMVASLSRRLRRRRATSTDR